MQFRISLLLSLTPIAALPATDPVVDCRAAHAADPRAHIACLEAALQGRDLEPVKDPVVRAEPAAAEQNVAAQATEPAIAGTAIERVVATAETAPPPPTGMGAEQVLAGEQSDTPDEELVLHIIGSSYNSRGLGTFRTEEGQVWRETTPSPERRRLKPDRQYTARIVRSNLGGYRMHVDGVRWMKTVERIE
jgi:hypothetical protein